ncbi:glutamate racemase [Halalkalibacillus halophilus]|uniref:glutamate racemase n=1 Tax=Halalkalibacillus halophilus TaxID=392827 RepID=UPI000429196E
MNQPIGVIDSGVGGLTVLHELKRQLPREKFIYLGDTKRCPYGSRTSEEVVTFTWELVDFLMGYDIKMLIVACNTATAVVLQQLKEQLDIPVIGVIEPGARAAIKSTNTNHIAIIGTENTILSRSYDVALKEINPELQTISVACPLFVPLIESGKYSKREAKEVVDKSLRAIKKDQLVDTLILGCTHYPILQSVIEEVVGESITVLSSALETGAEVSTVLTFSQMHNVMDQDPQAPEIYVTGDLQSVKPLIEEFFQFKSSIVKQVTLA